MKTIPGNNAGPQWSSKLFDDLVFIRKHRRYPFSKKTILPISSIVFVVVLGSRLIYTSIFLHRPEFPAMIWVVFALMALAVGVAVYNYYSILRFKSISTPFSANENTRLTDEFLRSQQLNVYRHPQAPEVMQILSRPLGNTEQREVMIFIADDKRILINSHFINQKWTLSPQSRNAKQMANRLQEWLKIHYPNSESMTLLN